jgi:NADH-quinone oxidoreductase subunit J
MEANMETLMFFILAAITLVSAFFVISLRRPIHNVLFMVLTMIGFAGLFALLQAEFIAMVQLIVYAGAVMVLFLFVIMLLNLDQLRLPNKQIPVRWLLGAVIALLVVIMLIPVIRALAPTAVPGTAATGVTNTESLATALFTTYLLPFEIASVLLLAAIIGAVILARYRSPGD